MAEILMFGVRHDRIESEQELYNQLVDFSPHLILLEGNGGIFSTERDAYIEELQQLVEMGNIRKEVGQILINEKIESGFEERAAFTYSGLMPVCTVDYLNDIPQRAIEEVKLTARRVALSCKERTSEDMRAQLQQYRSSSAAILKAMISIMDTPNETDIFDYPLIGRNIGPRDIIMAKVLRAKLKEFPEDAKICTITGMAHLFRHPEEKTFFDRVKDLGPKRVII